MPETMQTAPVLLTGSSDTALPAQPALLTVRVQVALLALALAFAASFGAAQDLSPITRLVCSLVTQLTAATLLGAAGTVIVVMFGWNKLMGEQNAFQSLKTASSAASSSWPLAPSPRPSSARAAPSENV